MSWNKNQIKKEWQQNLGDSQDTLALIEKLAHKYNLSKEDIINIVLSD